MEEPKVYWITDMAAKRVHYDEDSVIDIAEHHGNVLSLQGLENWLNRNTYGPPGIHGYHFVISNKEQWQQ